MAKTSQDIADLEKGKGRASDYLTRLVAPGQVIVERAALEAVQARVVKNENQLKTALGTIATVYLLSAPAAALQANKRGAGTAATIGAGLLGPVYLLFSGYREGLGR
jgi:hypothetical protein